jgi:predicted nucleotidyltransferase
MLQDYLERIKQNVLSELAEENVAVALFGSAAVGTETCASDVDVAIIPRGMMNRAVLSRVRERVEELTVPYVVDIVDFSMVSESFKNNALTHAIWWRT